MSEYLPIEDHGAIGDLRTVALVGNEGTIDWHLPGRFDAPSIFGALLDGKQGGYYSIAPAHDVDQARYTHGSIWCRAFSLSFAMAELRPS